MAYNDLQVHHIAGLIKAWLGAALCKSKFRSPQPRPPADNKLPCIAVYRESEVFEGTEPGFREFTPKLVVKYYMGRQSFGPQLEDAWGSLHAIVAEIDKALIAQCHAGWESGQDLATLAGISSIEAGAAVYAAELPEQPGVSAAYPCVSVAVTFTHNEVDNPIDETAYAKMTHHFDLDAHPSWPKTATLNATGPVTATWAPVRAAVRVRTVPGAALGVVVAGTLATVTLVPGTTTYAAIKLAWDAVAAAVALATLTGTAGVVDGAYPGETLHLWYDDEVFGFDALVTEATL